MCNRCPWLWRRLCGAGVGARGLRRFRGAFGCGGLGGGASGGRRLCRDHTCTLEFTGLRSCSNGRTPVILGGELAAIGAGRGYVFSLSSDWLDVALVCKPFLLGSWARGETASATVEADAIVSVDVPFLINVVDEGGIDVVHAAVVEKVAAVPVAASVAFSAVTKTVINAAVEADLRAPVAFIPRVVAVSPTPITGRPKNADFGRLDPSAGDEEVAAVVGVAPVAR